MALLPSLLQPLASALACPKPASMGFRNCRSRCRFILLLAAPGPALALLQSLLQPLASALATASIRVSKLLPGTHRQDPKGPAAASHCSWPHLGQLWLYFNPLFSPFFRPFPAPLASPKTVSIGFRNCSQAADSEARRMRSRHDRAGSTI